MTSSKSQKPNNLVQTIERTSLILDILGQSPQRVSMRDLSEKIKLPKGTTHPQRTHNTITDHIQLKEDLKAVKEKKFNIITENTRAFLKAIKEA